MADPIVKVQNVNHEFEQVGSTDEVYASADQLWAESGWTWGGGSETSIDVDKPIVKLQ